VAHGFSRANPINMTHELINPTTVALALLLVVLLVAAVSRLWVAIATSIVAMLVFNFFFIPPVGTFSIADPQNWVALVAFLVVSVVASQLSATARLRAKDAEARRDELSRLFDVGRDVLLTPDDRSAHAALARLVARRFAFDAVAICLPREAGWDVFEGGRRELAPAPADLARIFGQESSALPYDAQTGSDGSHVVTADGRDVTIVPLRLGTRPIGLLALAGTLPGAGALDALGGIVAIAIERAHFLDELKAGELARQREELKSALLASIAHDLRTPLTAIRVAASNLQAAWLTEADRREQSEVVLAEVSRLGRLFENILEMARIDAGAIAATERWVTLSEIVEAAREQLGPALRRHALDVAICADPLVRVDPRLTAAALAQLLANATQYAPEGSRVILTADVTADGLVLSVRDHGPGIAAADLPHLFERFYRGRDNTHRVTGTGMGLSIARGLIAAENGRIWAENCADGGARFTIAVPTAHRDIEASA
jgi:two-component system sensor histidine kinase KdpD